ncbi:MAG: NAD(P)-dependent oxidoreductase [Pseudomonadota bacterium]
MQNVLIAGGTGFVGLNAARAFADKGVSVVVTSRKRFDEAGEALAADNALIRVEYVNLQSNAEVFELYTRYRFDGLVMLAHAHQYARTRAASNALYPMLLNCLEGARISGVKRLVLASSKAIYGGMSPPYNEDATFPIQVTYPGATDEARKLPRFPEFETTVKRTTEMIALDYAIPLPASTSGLSGSGDNHSLEVVALRYPIQWGPGYTAMGSPFSLIAHAAAGKIDSLADRTGYLGLPIAEFWNLLSGSASSYVKDSASAIVTAMLATTLPHSIYNVCSGFNDVARDQLEAVYRIVPGARDNIGLAPEMLDAGGAPDNGFNANRFKSDFGWQPEHASFDEAFADYVAWLQDNPY